MSRFALLLVAVLVVGACGESTPKDLGPLALAVVAGQDQQDTVLVQLPEVIDVVAGRQKNGSPSLNVITGPSFAEAGTDTLVQNLTPIANAIVNFVVTDPECGRPFAGSALTNAQGHAKERWVLGDKAKACVMEARLVDQSTGAPLVIDSIRATVLPGAPVFLMPKLAYMGGGTRHDPYTGFGYGDTVPLASIVDSVVDRHGNHVTTAAFEYTVQDSMLRKDAATWVWKPGPAILDTSGVLRLYVRADSAMNFIWIRVPQP